MKAEQFNKKLRAIPSKELAEKTQQLVSDLAAKGDKVWTMTVPPRIDDSDMLLSEVIRRFEFTESQLEKEREKDTFEFDTTMLSQTDQIHFRILISQGVKVKVVETQNQE